MNKTIILILACTGIPLLAMEPQENSQAKIKEEKTYNLPNQRELDDSLMYCINFNFYEGHFKIGKLLDQGANPNASQSDFSEHPPYINLSQNPPLVQAAKNGMRVVCQKLLGYNANPNCYDWNHQTALLTAAQGDHQDIIKLLLVHGANPNWRPEFNSDYTALILACKKPSLESCRLLVQYKADVNEMGNQEEITPLMCAAKAGKQALELCKFLVANKAHVETTNRYHTNALIVAAKFGHLQVCKFLVDAVKKQRAIAFLVCLRRTDKTNILYRHRRELFSEHFQNGKPNDFLVIKENGFTAYDLKNPIRDESYASWLKPDEVKEKTVQNNNNE